MSLLLWLTRLILPALLIAGLIVDQGISRFDEQKDESALVETEVRVPGSESLSSTWYCPTAHSRKLGDSGVAAEVELLVTNTATEPTRASVHLISPTSAPQLLYLEVPGLSTRSLEVATHTDDELVSALVEAPTSGVVATFVIFQN